MRVISLPSQEKGYFYRSVQPGGQVFIMRFILRSVFQSVISFFLGFSALQAQQSVYQVGEIGLGIGAGHYFGDLVGTATYDRPKIAATAFYRKKLNDLIAARLGLSFAQLGYSDTYNAKTKGRNLSFNSAVWELTLQGDLDLSRLIPGLAQYNIMPYFTVGAGVFSYDPYTYLQGEKIFLRPLGTGGQGSVLYPDRRNFHTPNFSFFFKGFNISNIWRNIIRNKRPTTSMM